MQSDKFIILPNVLLILVILILTCILAREKRSL